MARWQQALAVVAGLAVGGALSYGTYTLVRDTLIAPPQPEPVTAQPTDAPQASPDSCDWASLPEGDRPAVATQEDGLPTAYALGRETWACADGSWQVVVGAVEGDGYPMGIAWQSLYLQSPRGDMVLLYGLRNDVRIEVVGYDVPAQVAWLGRDDGSGATQVVEMDLADGYVAEDWGRGGVPASHRTAGAVWNVRAVHSGDAGGELWAGTSSRGDYTALFTRVEGRTFAPVPGQQAIDTLRGNGSVTPTGEPGVGIVVAADWTYALALAQQPEGADPAITTGRATWVVIDLQRGMSRVSSTRIPDALCTPLPGATLAGTYDAPGSVRAACPAEGAEYDLATDVDTLPPD